MTLNTLLEKNYSYLSKVALHFTKNKERAHDLVIETYLDLTNKGTKLPEPEDEFIRFFWKCMRNQYYGHYTNFAKLACKEVLINKEIEVLDDSDPSKVSVLMPEVERFKTTLDDLDKTLFELIYEDDLTYKEIAEKYKENTGYEITINNISFLAKKLKTKVAILKNNH